MASKDFKTLHLDLQKQYAILKFNRPKASNGFNDEMGLELLEALNQLALPEIRSVVVTGEGPDFCIGMDPEFMKKELEGASQMFRRVEGGINQVISELRRLAKPVVAAVNGKAAGTGFSIALACDFILASQDATFSSTYINIGISPDGGLSYFLNRLVGPLKTAELVMTGKAISAKKALEMGLLSGVVPVDRLLEEATSLAAYFASGPTLALGKVKRLMDTAVYYSLEEQLEEERQALIQLGASEDYQEGIRSFLEGKKKPGFTGK
jgi:2-(1,2-epoxy-1,2-dihydrophenyl)acetyl-CoA isomerase